MIIEKLTGFSSLQAFRVSVDYKLSLASLEGGSAEYWDAMSEVAAHS